jgi:hypothetical protein
VNREEQLEWEARWSRPAAAAAAAAAVLPIASALIRFAALGDAGKGDRGALLAFNEQQGLLILSTCLAVLGYLSIALVLVYLFRASAARRSETPSFGQPLAVVGALAFSVATIFNLFEVLDIAGTFTDSGPETERRADQLLGDRSPVGGAFGLGGGLALAVSTVLVGINAMRAGLLSRFMGILGVIVGAFNVIPLFPLPIVQTFWFGALAVLFLDRWPNGRGPAWAAGEAIPWPSATDQAKAREAAQRGELPEPEEPSAPKRSRKKRKR